jgi:hypothetical protein
LRVRFSFLASRTLQNDSCKVKSAPGCSRSVHSCPSLTDQNRLLVIPGSCIFRFLYTIAVV